MQMKFFNFFQVLSVVLRSLMAKLNSFLKKIRNFADYYLEYNLFSTKGKRQRNHMDIDIMDCAFDRTANVHWDETNAIAKLFSRCLKGKTMLDVGGHHGSALMPFLNKDWRIFVFEPDEKNRAKLLENLARHKNKELVTLDTRCVSNKSQKRVCFYRSEQSTGISGLSAFHESHFEAQRVDTMTLTEFFSEKSLPMVDFLKIDTEGHDLFVLQGFPWDRGKPKVIECEFEDTKTIPLGYTFHDIAKYLINKGYTVYVSEWHPIVRYGIQHHWNRLMPYPCELADSKSWGNLLAFRDPIDEKDLVSAVNKVLKFGSDNKTKAASSIIQKKDILGAIFRIKPTPFFKPIGSNFFKPTASNQWRYKHSDASHKYWIAYTDCFNQTAGYTFFGMLLIHTNQAMRVNVSIGRHGTTDYEGEVKSIKLLPGVTERVELSKKFVKSHPALKLQVEVVELYKSRRAKLKLEPLYINKSLPMTVHNVNNTNFLFKDSQYLFVLGNGPSLKNIDFNQLKGHPTIGMNVAFRHWQKIGWYPTYYICLDTVVTASQKDDIFSLIKHQEQNGIKLFMLRKNILNFYPQLRENPSVLIYEDYEQNPIFEDADHVITTGSYAVLFGVMMGYKKIYLSGIDLNYVQQIPEAKNIKGIILEMTRTPEKNPNYFFDDYQQKGDRFNIPDSYPNLHYRSWMLVKERTERFGVNVINLSPVSKSKLDMFDYLDIPTVLKGNNSH